MDNMLSDIFFDAGFIFIIIGTFFALVLGLGLIIAPAATLKLNERINTRISLRKKTRAIETPIQSEPFFYKHSKISGLVLIIGSAFVLYTLVTFNEQTLIPYLPKSISAAAWSWLLQAGHIFFLVTCTFILLFGLVVFIRPSEIKRFEQAANHWISTRQHFASMSKDINFTNKLVNTYPRGFGIGITVFSVFVLFLLLPAL